MVIHLPCTTLCGKYVVVFKIFIMRITTKKSSKKVYGNGFGKKWWGQKNPKVTFRTINDHIFEKKRLLLQDHDKNSYDPTMSPIRKQKTLWY